MKKIFFLMITSCLFLTSCIDGDDPKPFFYGFATVEKNSLLGYVSFESDLDESGKGSVYKALNDVDPKDQLKDGDRVYMSCTIEKDYGDGKNYDVSVNSCSLNLSKFVSIDPIAPGGLQDVFINLNQSYISKDARQRVFLNMSVSYSTKTDNSDSFVLAYNTADQDAENPSRIVLILKHYQKEKMDTAPNVNDVLAFNLNTLPISETKVAVEKTLVIKYTSYDDNEKTVELPFQY